MSNKFLVLGNDVIVEIGGPLDARTEMHTSTAEKVATTFKAVADTLEKIIEPIANSFRGLATELNQPVEIGSAEIEIGISFSAEGNVFVAKSKAEGTLSIKILLTPSSLAPNKRITSPGVVA